MKNKKTPREANAEPETGFVADTIAQAAAVLDCPVVVLKKAKRDGCKAFRHGRVHISELKAWLEENPPQGDGPMSKAELECRRLLAQCEKIEFENEVSRGLYTPNSELKTQGLAIANATRSELLRIKSVAPTWEGLGAVEIERRATELVDSIIKNLHDSLRRASAL